MSGREPDFSRLLLSADPNRAGSANQRKGIIPNQFGRAFQLKLHRISREWPNPVKFIGDAQNHARGISTVSHQRCVVGKKRELFIYTVAGKILYDHLLALYVTLKP